MVRTVENIIHKKNIPLCRSNVAMLKIHNKAYPIHAGSGKIHSYPHILCFLTMSLMKFIFYTGYFKNILKKALNGYSLSNYS